MVLEERPPDPIDADEIPPRRRRLDSQTRAWINKYLDLANKVLETPREHDDQPPERGGPPKAA